MNRNTDVNWIGLEDAGIEAFMGTVKESIRNGSDGISIVGYYKEVLPLIDMAVDSGIPVMTFNSDLPESKRMSFVGQNPFQAGITAGDMMAKELEGLGKFGIIASNFSISDHHLRIEGFKKVLGKFKDYQYSI